MRAVRLYEYGGPEKLIYEEDVPDPVLGDSTVLVEAVAASVNPIDWKVRSGARQKDFRSSCQRSSARTSAGSSAPWAGTCAASGPAIA